MYVIQKLRQIKEDMIKAFKNGNLIDYLYKQNLDIVRNEDNSICWIKFLDEEFCIYLNVNMEDNLSSIIFGRNIDNSYIEPILSGLDYKKWEKVSIPVNIWGNIKGTYPTAMYDELSKLST